MKKTNILLLGMLLLSACNNTSSSLLSSNKGENINNNDPSFIYEKTSDKEITLDIEERETYDNKFLEDRIPNQWPSYGVGDPYVYRFNGKFYLYCSTRDGYVGVKAWVSDDMMDWTPITGEGLREGFVCEDGTSLTAYAPEVIYRNGYFYMCQSQGGNGHYLYRSLKPEGPFVKISDNINESIDGSFFIDDDEEMYFLRSGDKGINIRKFNDNLEFTDHVVIESSYMNGWTEGPYLLKRDGIYYLTYTGNHIMSNAYRVSYSYASKEDFENNYTFNKGDVLLINTDLDFKGLGHSSTVMGPDLDSYYVAYHNLINTNPTRNFNLARLSFNGVDMKADTCSIYDNFAPRMPKFSSYSKEGLTHIDNIYLNDIESNDIFSAEYNFIGNNADLYFSYVDYKNYNYINVNDNVISVYEVTNGNENKIQSVKLNKEYDYTKLHTIRIAFNETLDVYFDNCRKIYDLNIKNDNGLIGYSDNVKIEYTALSDVAKGSSDSKEYHQNNISLDDYYYSNNEIELSNGMYKDSKSIVLKNNDVVAYPLYINEENNYNFDLIYKKEYAGKKVKFRIDDGDYIVATLPNVLDVESEYIKTTVFSEGLSKGYHTLSIHSLEQIELMELSINKFELEFDDESYSLTKEEDLNYISEWIINDNGHVAKATDRHVLYVPINNVSDAVIEADVTILASSGVDAAVGLVLRADNAGLYTTEDQTGIQGYFCGVNTYSVFISKYNYEYSLKDLVKENGLLSNNKTYHLKATIKGNNITFDFNNGKFIMEYNDPMKYSSGNFGLYADNVSASFKNLTITQI